MPEIAIQVRDFRFWFKKWGLESFCRHVIGAAWQSVEPAEVSLVLANDSFIHVLNRDYRGKDCPTNVLSFENAIKPPKGQPWLAGDIIVAYETLCREAHTQKKSFESHLAHLLIHGTLHLQGYDHINIKQAHQMERLEVQIMKKLGYKNPYQNVE